MEVGIARTWDERGRDEGKERVDGGGVWIHSLCFMVMLESLPLKFGFPRECHKSKSTLANSRGGRPRAVLNSHIPVLRDLCPPPSPSFSI